LIAPLAKTSASCAASAANLFGADTNGRPVEGAVVRLSGGQDRKLITDAIRARKGAARVLPFRYVAAARAVPTFEPAIDEALRNCVSEMLPLEGGTTVLVDVSHSMDAKLSAKSDLTRMDAAATLASVIPGDRRVFTFSTNIVEVPARVGMAGIEQMELGFGQADDERQSGGGEAKRLDELPAMDGVH